MTGPPRIGARHEYLDVVEDPPLGGPDVKSWLAEVHGVAPLKRSERILAGVGIGVTLTPAQRIVRLLVAATLIAGAYLGAAAAAGWSPFTPQPDTLAEVAACQVLYTQTHHQDGAYDLPQNGQVLALERSPQLAVFGRAWVAWVGVADRGPRGSSQQALNSYYRSFNTLEQEQESTCPPLLQLASALPISTRAPRWLSNEIADWRQLTGG